MTYDVDYFIDKFSKIPEHKWGTNIVSYYAEGDSPKCALGHCRVFETYMQYSKLSNEGRALCFLFNLINPQDKSDTSRSVWSINDGLIWDKYNQPTPKQRILAALYDIKKMQEGEKEKERIDITKDLAVFPVDEVSDVKTKTLVS